MMKGLALLALLLALPACVERKMIVRSDPPGAAVYLNRSGEPAGTTPLELPFSYYGTYEVRLEREGCRPLEAKAPVPAPWYEYPVLDFVTELVLPVKIRDHREFDFALEPRPPEPDLSTTEAVERYAEEARKRNAEVRERAEEMKRRVEEGDPATVE